MVEDFDIILVATSGQRRDRSQISDPYPPAIVVWPLFSQALRFLQEPYCLCDGVGEEAGSFACGIHLSWTKTDL